MKLTPIQFERIIVSMLALIIAAGTVVVLYEPENPYRQLGGDRVIPTVVKPGGYVTVVRNFEVVRNTTTIIVRRMASGDCRITCTFIDLPSGPLSLPLGTYAGVMRDIQIPETAEPGKWRLEYSTKWETPFGRTLTAPWPVIELEITK